uniref:NFAM1 Ig-like domain-containing protein n=1 Tax=Apteryx owenii TaxID=8824 RepID=A0A8B9PZ94_APTOW
MASNLRVIFLFLWSLQCGGGQVNVQQRPPIQVALLKEKVSIPCKVTFPYMMKYTKFSIIYYWINSVGKKTFIYNKSVEIHIPPGEENRTTTQSYNYKTMPLESTSFTGTYYCEVKWNDIAKMGGGIFVLVRDAGYIQTSYTWEILITLTALLAALSITGTALLLWKRKVVCPGRNQLLNIPRHKMETQPPSANPAPATPIYDNNQEQELVGDRHPVLGHAELCLFSLVPMVLNLFRRWRGPYSAFWKDLKWREAGTLVSTALHRCLDSQQVDVYSVLGSNTEKLSCRRSPPVKTPKKQGTLEESFDTLYENI